MQASPRYPDAIYSQGIILVPRGATMFRPQSTPSPKHLPVEISRDQFVIRSGDSTTIRPNSQQPPSNQLVTDEVKGRSGIRRFDPLTVAQACDLLGQDLAQFLDADEREEMRAELSTALASGDGDALTEAMLAWRATAEVLRDPALAARLMTEGDPSEEVALKRP